MQYPPNYLQVSIPEQRMVLLARGQVIAEYRVSTAKNGAGERRGSECTPRGWHVIRAKIGGDAPPGSVFVGRRPTGEIYDERLAVQFPARDWILTRILWLGGLQPGFNRYGDVDTAWRFIYIHGSPDSGVTGQPLSHGCIRMTGADVTDLFDRVSVGTRVLILPDSPTHWA